jgi:hypothetical protein
MLCKINAKKYFPKILNFQKEMRGYVTVNWKLSKI